MAHMSRREGRRGAGEEPKHSVASWQRASLPICPLLLTWVFTHAPTQLLGLLAWIGVIGQNAAIQAAQKLDHLRQAGRGRQGQAGRGRQGQARRQAGAGRGRQEGRLYQSKILRGGQARACPRRGAHRWRAAAAEPEGEGALGASCVPPTSCPRAAHLDSDVACAHHAVGLVAELKADNAVQGVVARCHPPQLVAQLPEGQAGKAGQGRQFEKSRQGGRQAARQPGQARQGSRQAARARGRQGRQGRCEGKGSAAAAAVMHAGMQTSTGHAFDRWGQAVWRQGSVRQGKAARAPPLPCSPCQGKGHRKGVLRYAARGVGGHPHHADAPPRAGS